MKKIGGDGASKALWAELKALRGKEEEEEGRYLVKGGRGGKILAEVSGNNIRLGEGLRE